jgi:hypothetical protein
MYKCGLKVCLLFIKGIESYHQKSYGNALIKSLFIKFLFRYKFKNN